MMLRPQIIDGIAELHSSMQWELLAFGMSLIRHWFNTYDLAPSKIDYNDGEDENLSLM